MSIFTPAFAKAAAERAVKTVAQSAAALLLSDATGILDADWTTVASVSGLAGLISLLTSIGTGAASDGNPSATGAEVTADRLDP